MKNIKLNSKKLMIILSAGFILITSASCSNEKVKTDNNQNYNSSYTQINDLENKKEEKYNETTTENNYSNTEESKPSEENITNNIEDKTVENNPDVSYTNSDVEIINYFNDVEKNVELELKNEDNETVKDKLKGTFITIVDFLFYDSEINGIKFDDLTEGAKQNILETVSSIDNKIMAKYPNYKEEISSSTKNAYNRASEIIKKGANNVKEFSKEKLGEENYNSIIKAKDELVYYTKNAVSIIGEIAGSVWEKGKSKIKTWYENFRN